MRPCPGGEIPRGFLLTYQISIGKINTMTKKAILRRGKDVHVVIAYRMGGNMRNNRVFFEVFNSRRAAKEWCAVVEAEGFRTQTQRKTVIH